jgi:hypothetical protein
MLDVALTQSMKQRISGLVIPVRSLQNPEFSGYLLLDKVDTSAVQSTSLSSKLSQERFCVSQPTGHIYSKTFPCLIEKLQWVEEENHVTENRLARSRAIRKKSVHFTLIGLQPTDTTVEFTDHHGLLTIKHIGFLAHQFVGELPYALVSLVFSAEAVKPKRNPPLRESLNNNRAFAQPLGVRP